MIIAREKTWYSTLTKREYCSLDDALLFDRYRLFERFIHDSYYVHEDGWVYIQDGYLYERWLVYLTLLQCTIHPNIIKDCKVFEGLSMLSDTIPDEQSSIPPLFMKYRNDFRGPGWYMEDSVFDPTQDFISIRYRKADENPMDDISLFRIELGTHKKFGGWA